MIKYNLLVILIIILFISCDKDETSFPGSLYAPIIHGYTVTDDFGNTVKIIGTDDSKRVDPQLNSMNVRLRLYPNPCTQVITLDIGGPGISKKIWIVPANSSNFITSFNNSACITVNGLPITTVETTSEILEIALDKFTSQYFRVYVKIDDILLWGNIVKQ